MKTPIIVKMTICEVAYTCPHCKNTTRYETDGMPPKAQCHKCLKKLEWEVIPMPEIPDNTDFCIYCKADKPPTRWEEVKSGKRLMVNDPKINAKKRR